MRLYFSLNYLLFSICRILYYVFNFDNDVENSGLSHRGKRKAFNIPLLCAINRPCS